MGKSTLARRYVRDHPGVLNCDVDVLRTFIGGWQDDFGAAGALIRPAALALIQAYLVGGHDVVLPQMLVDPAELARFESCATGVGAQYVERVLMDTPTAVVERFARRGATGDPDPWHDQVRAIVAAEGGDAVLVRYHEALEHLLQQAAARGRDRELRRRSRRDLSSAARVVDLSPSAAAALDLTT